MKTWKRIDVYCRKTGKKIPIKDIYFNADLHTTTKPSKKVKTTEPTKSNSEDSEPASETTVDTLKVSYSEDLETPTEPTKSK